MHVRITHIIQPQGGESLVIDGEAVLQRVTSAAEEDEDWVDLGFTAPVDLTERISTGGIANGREAFGPVFRRTEDGTLWWRRMVKNAVYENGIAVPENGSTSVIGDGNGEYQVGHATVRTQKHRGIVSSIFFKTYFGHTFSPADT